MAALTVSHYFKHEEAELQRISVGEMLRKAAAETPQLIAMEGADAAGQIFSRWTFVELLADAEKVAAALLRLFRPGEHVAIWAHNSAEWIVFEFGAALAGLTLVPVNPSLRKDELSDILARSGAAALFHSTEYRGVSMADIGVQLAEELENLRFQMDLKQWMGAIDQFERGANLPELPIVAADSPAQIQYTSGTTGAPKGVMLHHTGLVNNARFAFERAGISSSDKVLLFMPLFHTAGCANVVLGALQSRCRLIVADGFVPTTIVEIIAAQQVTLLMGVPTMLVAVMEALKLSGRDISSIRLAIAGGSPVSPDVVQMVCERLGCRFETLYGQTEASPIITQHSGDEALADVLATVGRPLPGTEVAIRDSATGELAKIGAVGEILVRGYAVMLGYYNDPAATQAAVDAQGVNRRSIGTPYRRAKGTPLALHRSIDVGRGFRAAGGVGRA